MEERREVVVRGTAGPASVGKGELTRGEAPAGIVIWKLWGVGGVSGAGVAALLLKEERGVENSSLDMAVGVCWRGVFPPSLWWGGTVTASGGGTWEEGAGMGSLVFITTLLGAADELAWTGVLARPIAAAGALETAGGWMLGMDWGWMLGAATVRGTGC